MSKQEPKLIITEDLLKQVLKNQQVLLWHLNSARSGQKWIKDRIDETQALLERME